MFDLLPSLLDSITNFLIVDRNKICITDETPVDSVKSRFLPNPATLVVLTVITMAFLFSPRSLAQTPPGLKELATTTATQVRDEIMTNRRLLKLSGIDQVKPVLAMMDFADPAEIEAARRVGRPMAERSDTISGSALIFDNGPKQPDPIKIPDVDRVGIFVLASEGLKTSQSGEISHKTYGKTTQTYPPEAYALTFFITNNELFATSRTLRGGIATRLYKVEKFKYPLYIGASI